MSREVSRPVRGRLSLVLAAAAAGLTALVAYLWFLKIGNDLDWDEALNYRTYARHPLAAVGLYREPNNHPLDSLFKSLFHGVLGLDEPRFYKLPAFLLVLGFLLAVRAWWRRFAARGAWAAAALAVVLLLFTSAVQWQAMWMRGYFPSILAQLVYFLLLAREARLLAGEGEAGPSPGLTRRQRLLFGLLSGVLVFIVPSNLMIVAILWPTTVLAFGAPGGPVSRRLAFLARELAWLAAAGALFTLVLYAPLLASWLAGFTEVHRLSGKEPASMLRKILREPNNIFRQSVPLGLDYRAYLAGLGVVVAASIAAARRRPAARAGLVLLVTTLVVTAIASAMRTYGGRVRGPFAACVAAATLWMVFGLTARWGPRLQGTVGALILAGGFLLLPAAMDEHRFDRDATEMVAFVETYTRPGERFVVVCHDDMLTLHFYVNRAFGPTRVFQSRADMVSSFEGEDPRPDYPEGSLRRRLRDTLFPRDEVVRVDPDAIDVLVFFHAWKGRGPYRWRHPDLARVRSRLPRSTVFTRGAYTVEIFEKE